MMRNEALIALTITITIFFLAGVAMFYRQQYRNTERSLIELQAQVQLQNDAAKRKLAELTAQRDLKQAAIDQAFAEQETKDAHAKAEIDRLALELEQRPVRVRIQPAAGGCSGSPASEGATPASAGVGNTAPPYGLLPAENSRRLGLALREVETLSAAYTACRNRLMPQTP